MKQVLVEDCMPKDKDYALEIGCFEGCIYGVKSFRAIRKSTYEYGSAIPKEVLFRPVELGPWNRWYVQAAMKAVLALPEN